MPRTLKTSSPAVASLLARCRQQLGLSLREVHQRTARAGTPIPSATLHRIEQGRLDPGLKRLHHLLSVYGVRFSMLEDLLDLEELSEWAPAPDQDLEALFRSGIEHFERGEVRSALAALFTLKSADPEEPAERLVRQKALVSFGIAAGRLGKNQLALRIYEDLFRGEPDETVLVPLLVAASYTWYQLGATEMSEALLDRAEKRSAPESPRERSWIAHQRALVLAAAGDLDEAERRLDGALDAYRAVGDRPGEGLALSVRVDLLERRGDREQALAAARDAQRFARRHRLGLQLMARQVDEGRLLVDLGRAKPAARLLEQVAHQASEDASRRLEFLARYHLARAADALGDADRAALARAGAGLLVRFVDDELPEAREARAWDRPGDA
jgi:tetratricopeptide (TPR) repeat protein